MMKDGQAGPIPDEAERRRHGARSSRHRGLGFRLVVASVSLLLSLGVAELIARVLEPTPSRIKTRAFVPNPLVPSRAMANVRESDARGYRNASARDHADIVAIGDSQTWGFNAKIDDSWPVRLEQRTGRSVYNMAFAGYGPVHYRALVDEALELHPSLVIVGLYLGNDLWDAFITAYSGEDEKYRHPDAQRRQEILDAPRPPLRKMVAKRINYGKPARRKSSRTSWLERSALGRLLLSGMTQRRRFERDREWALAHPKEGWVYEEEPSTVFHPAYNGIPVDLELPQVREGFRITEVALVEMRDRLRGAGVGFLVVLLPTKESVYADLVRASGVRPTPEFTHVVEQEAELRTELITMLEREGIAYVDSLRDLQVYLQSGTNLFPLGADAHFVASGYDRIAESIERGLLRQAAAATE